MHERQYEDEIDPEVEEYDHELEDEDEDEDDDDPTVESPAPYWRKPTFGANTDYISRTERELADRRAQYERHIKEEQERREMAEARRVRDSFPHVTYTAEQLAAVLDEGERPPTQKQLDTYPGDLHSAVVEARCERAGRYDAEVLAHYLPEVLRRLRNLPDAPTYSELREARAVVFDFHKSARNGLPCLPFVLIKKANTKDKIKRPQFSIGYFSRVRTLRYSDEFTRYQRLLARARKADYLTTPKGKEALRRKAEAKPEHARLERIRVATAYLDKLAREVVDARWANDPKSEAKSLAKADKRISKIADDGGGNVRAWFENLIRSIDARKGSGR